MTGREEGVWEFALLTVCTDVRAADMGVTYEKHCLGHHFLAQRIQCTQSSLSFLYKNSLLVTQPHSFVSLWSVAAFLVQLQDQVVATDFKAFKAFFGLLQKIYYSVLYRKTKTKSSGLMHHHLTLDNHHIMYWTRQRTILSGCCRDWCLFH